MITRGYNEPPAIDIESRVLVVDWRRAGPAPVTPTGTRFYDGYKLTRPSGEKEKRIVRDGAVYTTADGIEENAWVWTDIRQPSYTDFTNVYTLDHDTDGDQEHDALMVTSAHRDLRLMTHFARLPEDMREDDNESVNPVDRGIFGQNRSFNQGHQIDARFDGAYGIYTCIDPTCHINMTGREVTAFSGWVFMPKDETGAGGGTRPPQVLVPDSDYRYFGLWLRGPDNDNEGRFDIQTFAGGSEPFSGDVTALTGRATYIGPAAGQYAKDTDGGGADAGLFTAKMTLHADFGSSPKIHGIMENFRDGGRDLDWNLFFEATPINGTRFNGTTTSNGSTDNTGRYGGGFYGNGDDGYPNGAVGTFTGKFNDGLVIGSFGGTKAIRHP